MPEDIAAFIVAGGTVIGMAAWFVAIVFLVRMNRLPQRVTRSFLIAGRPASDVMTTLAYAAGTAGQTMDRTHDTLKIRMPMGMLDLKVSEGQAGTGIAMEMDFNRMRRMFENVMAVLVLAVEPLIVVGIPYVLWHFVVPHQNPAIRWQAVQVVQIIHVLWPPFLVYALYIRYRRHMEQVCVNLAALVDMGTRQDSA